MNQESCREPARVPARSSGGASGEPPRYDAVVLAGGRAARLGTPKPGLVVDGSTLLDHVLRATAGADRVVVVGPPDVARPGVEVVREDPPFGGPAAGLGAAVRALDREGTPPWLLVLACDVPRADEAVPHLLRWAAAGAEAPEGSPGTGRADGAVLAREGRDQWLVGLYRTAALRTTLDHARTPTGSLHGLPFRAVVGQLDLDRIDDSEGVTDDIDTPADLARWAGPDR
ncbi:molybdenum cofactor guanylyltransferase [Paraoerskovia sediminicola]|uniref:molybdenum cofactor guanylyltransferase n=1 Tax=Paraoerskovia sediminicola TaxID=1138587 RepID=UPI00257238F8|nr:NTP transferase domain-containing protein [Paraoerskovia sediminicola]